MRFIPASSQVAAASLVSALFLGAGPVTAANDATPTYSRDVAPILFEHCVDCHRPNQIAPMSLLSYEEVRPWAKSIRRVVADGTMPPWHADSSRVSYANDRRLSEEEISTLVRWAASGAPQGDPGDMPPAPELPEGWRLGEPDLVFEAKKGFVIPADGEEIPYQSLTFDIDLEEDLYIEAWEIRPSQLKAVHHANLVRSPVDMDGQSVGIAKAVMQGGDYIGSYLPGHAYVEYPEGMAYRLPKGSHLGIQVHYVSIGEEVEDRLRFGVHLAEGRVDKLVRVVGTDYRAIDIPPREPAYSVTDEVTVLYDMYALSSGIHMHLRGKSYTMEAVRPDGSVELITDVPRYDFNWQSNYVLAEPVFMPKGSKLRVTSVWDNSADNPYNPNPDARVMYGPWTEDEMVNAWTHVMLAEERLGMKVERGRLVGHFEDAQDRPQPFLIQSLPAADSFQKNAETIESHETSGD